MPNMEQGVGVWETGNVEAIKLSYSLDVGDNHVVHVSEKPEHVLNNLCGMGFYFLDKRAFEYIELTKPSPLRGEVEITEALQNMIDNGERITPVLFRGSYLNITYPEDLARAEAFVQGQG